MGAIQGGMKLKHTETHDTSGPAGAAAQGGGGGSGGGSGGAGGGSSQYGPPWNKKPPPGLGMFEQIAWKKRQKEAKAAAQGGGSDGGGGTAAPATAPAPVPRAPMMRMPMPTKKPSKRAPPAAASAPAPARKHWDITSETAPAAAPTKAPVPRGTVPSAPPPPGGGFHAAPVARGTVPPAPPPPGGFHANPAVAAIQKETAEHKQAKEIAHAEVAAHEQHQAVRYNCAERAAFESLLNQNYDVGWTLRTGNARGAHGGSLRHQLSTRCDHQNQAGHHRGRLPLFSARECRRRWWWRRYVTRMASTCFLCTAPGSPRAD